MKDSSTVLFISQVFVPDTPSVGQHLFDLARELTARSFRVVVFTPRRGYEDPAIQFSKLEIMAGIEVKRLPWCAFGKRSIPLRLLGGVSLVMQSMICGLFVKGLTHILVSTTPPMSGLAASFIKAFRRVRVVYWVMDLNPDQMIVTGKLRRESLMAKVSERIQAHCLRRADAVVALDRFMAERLQRKANLDGKLEVIQPWPYEDQFVDIPHEQNPFRRTHKLSERFVIMYSGNISDVHPLDTLWEAMFRLRHDRRFVFVFIGAQAARKRIEALAEDNKLKNVVTLAHVPLNETKFSLSAADLHVVTMGDNMVGVVHPCKVYGIMSVGRPFLAIGPGKSHIGEILDAAPVGWIVEHGDVDGVVKILEHVRNMSPAERCAIGARGRELVQKRYSRQMLCAQFAGLFHGIKGNN